MSNKGPKNLKQFLDMICAEYENARMPIIESAEIKRGRSRTISGISEDIFAVLMKNVLKGDRLCFFIDQPIRIEKKTFYPDLVIAKKSDDDKYKVAYMLDLKMDVGYHRNTEARQKTYSTYLDKVKELTSLCEQFKSVEVGYGKDWTSKKSKVDKDASRFEFNISPEASYDMVVITNENAGRNDLSIELLNFSKNPESKIWVLSTGDHPNEYYKPKIEPNTQDFNVLIDKIQRVINSER